MSSAKTSGLAIAALVLGIVGICMPILAPIALVLGIVALSQINKSNGGMGGQGLAIGGIVTGGIACAMIPILAAIAIPNFIRYQLRSKQAEAKVNLNAMLMQAENYKLEHGSYPAADSGWVPSQTCGEKRCAPNPSDWSSAPWSDLGFSMNDPHYYQYRYSSDGTSLTLEAQADLDGDGKLGLLRLEGTGSVQDQNPGEF